MSKEDLDIQATGRLIGIARKWYDQMLEGQIPSIALPTRTKQNIEYDDTSEVWKYGVGVLVAHGLTAFTSVVAMGCGGSALTSSVDSSGL